MLLSAAFRQQSQLGVQLVVILHQFEGLPEHLLLEIPALAKFVPFLHQLSVAVVFNEVEKLGPVQNIGDRLLWVGDFTFHKPEVEQIILDQRWLLGRAL